MGSGPARPHGALERRCGVAGLILRGQGGGEPRPGALQPLPADGGEVLAPFPEFERLLQGEPSAFQPPDHLDQLVACLLVGHLCGGCALGGLVTGGLATGGLFPAGRGAGGLFAGGLATRRAAAAFWLTWRGGHGANLAGYRPMTSDRPPGEGLAVVGRTGAGAELVSWTADATTFA